MQLTPLLAIHVFAALAAIVLGPFALWARWVGTARPKLHRAFGYAWVTMMLVAATSAIGLQAPAITWRWLGFSPIHLLILLVYASLVRSFWYLHQGNIRGHKLTMVSLYINACLITGLFTLAPGRFMNRWLFG